MVLPCWVSFMSEKVGWVWAAWERCGRRRLSSSHHVVTRAASFTLTPTDEDEELRGGVALRR